MHPKVDLLLLLLLSAFIKRTFAGCDKCAKLIVSLVGRSFSAHIQLLAEPVNNKKSNWIKLKTKNWSQGKNVGCVEVIVFL